MVDLSSPTRSRRVLLAVLAAIAVVALLATGFFIGRATEPAAAPGATEVTSAPSWHGPFSLTDRGIPFGYTQDEIGARTAAINALIGGVRLRSDIPPNSMSRVRLPLTPATAATSTTEAADLFLNSLNTETGGPIAPGQRAKYDFAPVVTAGVAITGRVPAEPIVTLGNNDQSVTVSFRWDETRTSAGAVVLQGTEFQVSMLWQIRPATTGNGVAVPAAGDWFIWDVSAVDVTADLKANYPHTQFDRPWLAPSTFVGSGAIR